MKLLTDLAPRSVYAIHRLILGLFKKLFGTLVSLLMETEQVDCHHYMIVHGMQHFTPT